MSDDMTANKNNLYVDAIRGRNPLEPASYFFIALNAFDYDNAVNLQALPL